MDKMQLDDFRNRLTMSAIARSVSILSRADKQKIAVIVVVQMCLGWLDLLGVLAIGLLGALSVTGLQSQNPGDRVSQALRILQISDATFQTQVSIIGTIALCLLVGRTMLSIFFTRRILFFLSRRGAKISANLISRLLAQPLLTVQARTTQEILYSVTGGVVVITLGILATALVFVSDLALLIIMAIGLFIVDPITAIGTFVIFALIGIALYRSMHVKAKKLGLETSVLNIKSNEKIVEVFSSYRESVVRNRRDYYAREIGKVRFALANANAEISFMPYVSKYVIETSVVLGALLISAAQFVLQDSTHAIATLAIFLSAGTRIAPAVLRLQQGSITIRGALGQATPTLDLIDTLGDKPLVENTDDTLDLFHEGFVSEIEVSNVSLTYPGKLTPAISNITLKIPSGASVAFVGSSGAGKTTIIDVLLGVLHPDEGKVSISGLSPMLAVAKWPGAVSYVPQDVVIAAGTIRENVALGYPLELATDDLVMRALKVAHLDKFIEELPLGIDTQVGERGAKLSGGQRQRLGIARAMFTRPHLLVLDEATSSLDGETEANITDAIHDLRGKTTVVMIAHRLSTVRNADIVIYLSKGIVMAVGTFDQVRNAVPDFDHQAKLMGL
jgi:ABC-type multidrug transport system fused ATPase/permease subunit